MYRNWTNLLDNSDTEDMKSGQDLGLKCSKIQLDKARNNPDQGSVDFGLVDKELAGHFPLDRSGLWGIRIL